MVKEIQLTKGRVALVDDWWYEELNQWKWCFDGRYVVRKGRKSEGEQYQITIKMHRVVNKTPKGVQTDHRDQNKCNNQEENLRSCNSQQNGFNKKKTKSKCSTPYIGVDFMKSKNKYRARIGANSEGRHIGMFDCEVKAAIERDKAALKHYNQEFVELNFKPMTPQEAIQKILNI